MALMFDTRSAMQRLVKGGLSETQADAVVDVTKDATTGLATKDDLEAALQRVKDQMRIEIWRAIALQTMLFTAIVAALTKL
jgi:hypothetical protein